MISDVFPKAIINEIFCVEIILTFYLQGCLQKTIFLNHSLQFKCKNIHITM